MRLADQEVLIKIFKEVVHEDKERPKGLPLGFMPNEVDHDETQKFH